MAFEDDFSHCLLTSGIATPFSLSTRIRVIFLGIEMFTVGRVNCEVFGLFLLS